MAWIASSAALHWGFNCLLWSAQAVLSTGAAMKRTGTVIPFYASKQGARIRVCYFHHVCACVYGSYPAKLSFWASGRRSSRLMFVVLP